MKSFTVENFTARNRLTRQAVIEGEGEKGEHLLEIQGHQWCKWHGKQGKPWQDLKGWGYAAVGLQGRGEQQGIEQSH